MKQPLAACTVVIALLCSTPTVACSLVPTTKAFVPDRSRFNREHDFPLAMSVPEPMVKVLSVERASSDVSGNCGEWAVAEVEIRVPADSDFDLTELGFMFRSEAARPQDRFMAFPNFPIQPKNYSSGVFRFTMRLVDPPTEWNKPFRLRVEVFAMNEGLQVGPSTEMLLEAPAKAN